MTEPVAKRPAFEPAERLLRPTAYEPGMRRPIATTAGSVLVLLRVVVGVLVLVGLALDWQTLVPEDAIAFDGFSPADAKQFALGLVLAVGSVVLLVEGLLAFLIFRGRNLPRVYVMVVAVLSISTSFAAWWSQGQAITIDGTLLSLGLDILILLALSSRSAAAYARRNERR